MRKLILIIAVAAVILPACKKKYEYGPQYNLRSKKERIANEWVVEQYLVNDVPDNSNNAAFKTLILSYKKDGTGSRADISKSIELQWEFGEDKKTLKTRYLSTDGNWGNWIEETIIRLEEMKLWLRSTYIESGVTKTIETHYLGS